MEPIKDPRSDEVLLKDYLAGDKRAFRVLVSRYEDSLVRFARRWMVNDYEAYRITKKTFWSAFQKLRHFIPTQKFSEWVYQICEEKCWAAIQPPQRRYFVPLPPDIEDKQALPASTKSAEQEIPRIKEECLEILDQEERLLYDLRQEQGKTFQEIAEHSSFKEKGLTVEALMMKFSRLTHKLREWLIKHQHIKE